MGRKYGPARASADDPGGRELRAQGRLARLVMRVMARSELPSQSSVRMAARRSGESLFIRRTIPPYALPLKHSVGFGARLAAPVLKRYQFAFRRFSLVVAVHLRPYVRHRSASPAAGIHPLLQPRIVLVCDPVAFALHAVREWSWLPLLDESCG